MVFVTTPNTPPVAAITTAAMTVDGGQTVSIAGTITDADGDSLTHEWSDNGGTLSSSSTTGGVAITDWDAPAATMVDQTITIELVGNDGEDDSNTATVVMTVRAIVETDVAGTVTAGDPTASGSLTILDAPTIDTIPAHANEVVRALITLSDFTEGDTVNENWFRIDSSLGSVSADSDMQIAGNLTLDRMRWLSSDQRVTLNRTGTAAMLDYFGTGDPGRTQFIFIAVADSEDHIAEIDIDAEFGAATISQLRLDTIPAAAQALLNLVQPGGVINLVIADEGAPVLVTDVAGTATAGDPMDRAM